MSAEDSEQRHLQNGIASAPPQRPILRVQGSGESFEDVVDELRAAIIEPSLELKRPRQLHRQVKLSKRNVCDAGARARAVMRVSECTEDTRVDERVCMPTSHAFIGRWSIWERASARATMERGWGYTLNGGLGAVRVERAAAEVSQGGGVESKEQRKLDGDIL